MFELQNMYFDIISRSWRFCRMWYLDYHGFEATIGLLTGRSGTQTSNMVRIRTCCLLVNQDIPPSYSFKQLRSWTFFRYFHALPRKRVRLEILPHMPTNAPTYTRRHTSSTVLTCTMSPKRKDGITDEQCSDMEIEYISLPKLKRQICGADLTGQQIFLCCMPRPAVMVDEMYKMQASDDNDGLDPVRRKLPIRLNKWADLYDRGKVEYGDLPPYRPGTDHRIRLDSEDNPPWVHPYEMDPSQLDELRRQFDRLHQCGRIRPSSSPYGAGCLLVKKANGKWRMCVD